MKLLFLACSAIITPGYQWAHISASFFLKSSRPVGNYAIINSANKMIIMKNFYIAFLLSTTGIFSTTLAMATTRHKQVQCDINEDDANALLKCVNESGVKNNVIVDEQGYLVIHPRDRRELDPRALDAALYKCIREATNKLSMAAHDNNKFDNDEDDEEDYTARSYKLEDVTFEQLRSQGWKGMTAIQYEDGFGSFGSSSNTSSNTGQGQDRPCGFTFSSFSS